MKKGMVNSMVKKEKQKTHMNLKRRIRKTIAGLSMASAIVVASIPVDNLQAVEGLPGDVKKVTLTEEDSRIPDITSAPVYTTGDGVYEFAYVFPKGVVDGDKIAVIVVFWIFLIKWMHISITIPVPVQVVVMLQLT